MRTAAVAVALLVTLGPVAAGQQNEGIKVHGAWTIEILNPDGTVVSHREFKNDLVAAVAGFADGPKLLIDLLNGTRTVTGWSIELHNLGNSGQLPCVLGNGGLFPCYIVTSNWAVSQTGPAEFRTLSKTVQQTPPALVFTGTATAERGGAIANVATIAQIPEPLQSSGMTQARFTAAKLPNAVTVLAGQIIQVKVVISFS